MESGMPEDEAHAHSGMAVQARLLLPVPPGLLKVARGHSKTNERYALVVRHFPADPVLPSPETLSLVREVARLLGAKMVAVFKESVGPWHNLDIHQLKPGSWTQDRFDRVREQLYMRDGDLRKQDGIRGIFIKMNEALSKEKPRAIQSMTDVLALLQSITIRPFTDVLFSPGLFESRSIKHVSSEDLPKRMASFLHRFRVGGLVMSVDFGSWDGTVTNALRAVAENELLSVFFDGVASGCVGRAAMKDRNKEMLRARSTHFHVQASWFGRESGDGGTSALNFATNVLLSMALEVWIARRCGIPTIPSETLKYRLQRKSWVDSFHEGDDSVIVATQGFIGKCGGPEGYMRHVLQFYQDLGLKLEPATSEGVSTDASKVLQPTTGRVEFVSRIFVPDDPPFSIGLVRRTVRGCCVTFSKGPLQDVAHAAAVSGQIIHARSPILRELYALLGRIAASNGGKSAPSDLSYAAKRVAAHEDVPELLSRLRAAASGTDCKVREIYAGEHPLLSVESQLRIEARLASFVSPTSADWGQISGILSEILECT
jgi:hypothetical protein